MSKISERLAAIRARCDSAMPAPWQWKLNPESKSVNLVGGRSRYVMSFYRWGMTGAAPAFQIDGTMKRADELAQIEPGREHHSSWHRTIAHHDADFIAHARADLPALVAVAEAAKRLLDHGDESPWWAWGECVGCWAEAGPPNLTGYNHADDCPAIALDAALGALGGEA